MKLPLNTRYFLSPRYAILALLLLVFALGCFRLDARTLHGDELGSVGDAEYLQRNMQSISFFISLRVWMLGGVGEFFLRALSVFFAVAAIAAAYTALRTRFGMHTALVASALLATAPFVEVYAQMVRYYALFLLAASLNYIAFFRFQSSSSHRNALRWGATCFFVLTTHALAFLLVVSELAAFFFLTPRLTTRQKAAATGIGAFLGALTLFSPLKAMAFNALASYTDAAATFSASRGISLSQFAKIPLTFYFFTFGESVYPFDFKLVLPGLALYGFAFILGLWRLRSQQSFFLFIVMAGILPIGLLYLVFDALIPPDLAGAAPRYLIFLLPLFYLVVAKGIQGEKGRWLIAPLLLVNAGALGSYWYGNWSYTDDLVNWRSVTQWMNSYVTLETLVITDGRSIGLADYYFPTAWNRQPSWNFDSPTSLEKLTQFPKIIFLSADFHADRRAVASSLMQSLDQGYFKSAAWSEYPLFIYVYDRTPNRANALGAAVKDGNVDIPAEIYGLEFQDLVLPVQLKLRDRAYPSLGSFRLPTLENSSSRAIVLSQAQTASKIILFSNATGADTIALGTPIANLIIRDNRDAIQSLSLRLGNETSAWNNACAPRSCTPAYTWRKRFALLGAERYSEAWQEFDASIFATELILSQPTQIQSLEIQRVSPQGWLYVWGIVLEP